MLIPTVRYRGFAVSVNKVLNNHVYFFYPQKAIEESESEWAQNQKLVEVSKIKGIKAAVSAALF